MGPKQLLERLGLGLAELWETHRRMTYGAVMLAQLRPGIRAQGRRGVSLGGKSIRKRGQATRIVRLARHAIAVTSDQSLGPLASERAHGLVAVRSIEIVESGDREVVVIDVEGMASRVGEGEDTGRTSASACRRGTERTLVVGLYEALGCQAVEMPTDHGRTVAEAHCQLRCGGRPTVQEGPRHALGGRTREFHTLIVSQIPRGAR